ncbi:MAG: DUF3667 domain-containing protein [Bacteroidota bacterium]
MSQSQERIDFRYILDGILKVFNFEKGLFLTTRELLLRPGNMIKDYLSGARRKYTHPIQFVFVYVGLWALFLNQFKLDNAGFLQGFENGMGNVGLEKGREIDAEEIAAIQDWMAAGFDYFFQYQNVYNIALIPLLSLLTYLFYRKFKLYYPEHLVLNAYITGMISFIGLLFAPIAFFDFGTTIVLGGLAGFLYTIWVYMDTFKGYSIGGFFKSLALNLSFYLLTVLLVFTVFVSYLLLFFAKTAEIG